MSKQQQTMSLYDIKANENNPRLITDENLDKLINSILIFPKMLDIRPLVLDQNNVILGGNMRHRALKKILGMEATEVAERIEAMREQRKKTDAEVQSLIEHWAAWKTKPEVQYIYGEFSEDEQEQFIIKDNVSAGDWDMDALENFDKADLQEWGVQTWGSVDSFMDYDSPDTPSPACADRQRIIITYPVDRKAEVEQLLGRELTKPNFRLEELQK